MAGGVPGQTGSRGWWGPGVRPQGPVGCRALSSPSRAPAAPPGPLCPGRCRLLTHWALALVSASRNLYSLTQKRRLAGLWEWKRRAYVQRQPSAWGRVSGDFEFLGKMVLTPLHQSREVGHPGPAAPPSAPSPPRARPATGRAGVAGCRALGSRGLAKCSPVPPISIFTPWRAATVSLDGRRSWPSGSGPLTVLMAQGQGRGSCPRLGVTLRLRLPQAPERIFQGLHGAGCSGAGWGPGGYRSSDRQTPSGRVTREPRFCVLLGEKFPERSRACASGSCPSESRWKEGLPREQAFLPGRKGQPGSRIPV